MGQRQRPGERNFGGRSLYIAHGSFETQSENSDHLRHRSRDRLNQSDGAPMIRLAPRIRTGPFAGRSWLKSSSNCSASLYCYRDAPDTWKFDLFWLFI